MPTYKNAHEKLSQACSLGKFVMKSCWCGARRHRHCGISTHLIWINCNGVPCPSTSIAVHRVNFRHKSGVIVIASSGVAAKHEYVSLVVVFGGCAGFASPKQAYKYGESDGYFEFATLVLVIVMSSSSASAWGSSTSIPASSLNVCLYGEKRCGCACHFLFPIWQ